MVARDRGQLLLLGGLAMAIVFLTAIPLANSLVVTESAATSETARDIDRTGAREASAVRAVRAIANRTDARNNTDAFNATLRNYSRYSMQVRGQRNGVYVNASMNRSASAREATGDFGPSVMTRFDSADLVNESTRIYAFNATVSDPQTAAGPAASPMMILVTNESGYTWRLQVYEEATTGDINVSTTHSGIDGWQPTDCDTDTDIEVNLTGGTCTTGPATDGLGSNYTEFIGRPYTVEIENLSSERGQFRIVTTGNIHGDASTDLAIPYVDLVYEGPDASYVRTVSTEGR